MSDTKESFDSLEAALNAMGMIEKDSIDWQPLDNIQRKWAIMSGFEKDLGSYFTLSAEIH